MKYLWMRQLALAIMVCCPAAGQAQNLTGTMGGTTFNLVVPPGFCITNPANSADTAFVNYLSKLLENAKNKLINVVVDCGELQARRAASKPIYDYMTYYFPTASENTNLSGDLQAARKQLCDELRQQSDAALADVPQIVEKTAREMKEKRGSVNSTKYLGVLTADLHGCYAGLLVGVGDGKGHLTLIYTIVIRTVIHGKDLWMGVYSRYGTNADQTRALELAQTTASALDARNPE